MKWGCLKNKNLDLIYRNIIAGYSNDRSVMYRRQFGLFIIDFMVIWIWLTVQSLTYHRISTLHLYCIINWMIDIMDCWLPWRCHRNSWAYVSFSWPWTILVSRSINHVFIILQFVYFVLSCNEWYVSSCLLSSYRWHNAKETSLQCVSNGITSILH